MADGTPIADPGAVPVTPKMPVAEQVAKINVLLTLLGPIVNTLGRAGPDAICPCHRDVSCLRTEDERPLNYKERAMGWARRPFNAYDTDRLCLSCRAYWHLSMAVQDLQRLLALVQMT